MVSWCSAWPWALCLYVVAIRKSSTYVRILVLLSLIDRGGVETSLIIDTKKSIGESGEPRGVPLSVAKVLKVLPLNLYPVCLLHPQFQIHPARCLSFALSIWHVLSRSRWSKPPSMSRAVKHVWFLELFVTISLSFWIASVVANLFLPPYILSGRMSSLAIRSSTALLRTLARMDWSWITLQLLAIVYAGLLSFGIRMVELDFYDDGIPWVHAWFIVAMNSFSLSLLNSLTMRVGMWWGLVAAPFGEFFRAASRLPVLRAPFGGSSSLECLQLSP